MDTPCPAKGGKEAFLVMSAIEILCFVFVMTVVELLAYFSRPLSIKSSYY